MLYPQDLRAVTMTWFDFNFKMGEELTDFLRKIKNSPGAAPTTPSPNESARGGPAAESSAFSDGDSVPPPPPGSPPSPLSETLLKLLRSDHFKNVKQNLEICNDALMRIKMDLTQSKTLRDRRQLETIILHLLDAVRCHTDGGDLLYELNDAKRRDSRHGSPAGSPKRSPEGGSVVGGEGMPPLRL